MIINFLQPIQCERATQARFALIEETTACVQRHFLSRLHSLKCRLSWVFNFIVSDFPHHIRFFVPTLAAEQLYSFPDYLIERRFLEP